MAGNVIHGTLTEAMPDGHSNFTTVQVPPDLAGQLAKHNVEFTGSATDGGALGTLLSWVLPPLLFVGIWMFASRMMMGGAGRRVRRRTAVGRALEGQAGRRDRREGHIRRRGRGGRGQGRAARDRRFPEAAGGVHAAGRAYPARHPAGGAAGHRQDAAGARGGGRGGGAVLLHQRRRVRRDVRGRRRGPGARPVRAGAQDRRPASSSSTSWMRWGGRAVSTRSPGRTRRSRRSTSCWPRWTGSTGRWRS